MFVTVTPLLHLPELGLELRAVKTSIASQADVFKQTRGVFVMHINHYHEEDIDASRYAEAIPHYITYNAGTRLLQTYPEVLILDDDEVNDPSILMGKLEKPPFLLKCERPPAFIRQVFVQVGATTRVPYAHH